MSLYAFHNPRVAFPALTAVVICSERVSVRGDCLTGDDSITYDRSFASSTRESDMNCCTAVYLTFLSRSILFLFTVPPQSTNLKYCIDVDKNCPNEVCYVAYDVSHGFT